MNTTNQTLTKCEDCGNNWHNSQVDFGDGDVKELCAECRKFRADESYL